MRIRRHRGFGALVLLIVLAMSALAVLPMISRGQTNELVGTVSDCGPTFIAGALVVLSDANGFLSPQNVTTGLDGVYTFAPPAGYYNLQVTRSGYFANGTTIPIRFDGSATVNQDICLTATPTPPKVLEVTTVDAGTSTPLNRTFVQAYTPANVLIASNTTTASGKTNLTLWAAVFQLRATLTNYSTNVTSVNVASVSTVTLRMENGGVVQGRLRDRTPTGPFLTAGVAGFLYNPSIAASTGRKVIRADVFGSLYRFHAPTGVYTMVIDANGHQANVSSVSVTVGSTVTRDVVLPLAANETYETTVRYGTADWNNLTIFRNLTLNPDTNLSNLNPSGMRNLRLQIDYTLGDGNGLINAAENTSFHSWFVANGPFYTATAGFLTTNGKSYLSAISYAVDVRGLLTAGSKVWINTTAKYALVQAPPYIASGAKTYFVNVTMIPDSNVSAYRDFVYRVALPRTYELNTSTTLPANAPVTRKNFTPVTIDPGVTTGLPQIRMTISQSLNGTARGKVAGPVGKFYAQNASFTNYQAFVANNTTLTFSAEDSTDPNGHITDANFTWKFTPSDVGYGIRPEYAYNQSGEFTVNLTVTEPGGNVSYRNITIFVDDQLPIARILTNRTGTGVANGLTLRVNEDTLVRFDGRLSTDLAYTGKNGVILDSGYSWDFDGDRIADATGRIVNWTFPKPGNFTLNVTVTDSVGWKSANATMTAIVNDTTAPTPAWEILDPSNDWVTISSPKERRAIALNASKTTDNYNKLADLNFTWTIPGPLMGLLTPAPHKFYGQNVSFAWAEWNNSYKVNLSVRDTGFGSGKPNWGNLSRDVTVQIDTTIHADLKFEANSMKVTPTDPEEGAPVTVTVNFTNKQSRATASNVTTELLVISGGQTTLLTSTAEWFDNSGNPKGAHTILQGETVKLVFTASISGQGNKTVQVNVFDSTEPTTWRTDNRPTVPVNVRQPAWQPYAIAGSVIGVIALFVGGMYARRKIKAGEWRPIRGRRKEKVEGEEKKPRKEVKEEKKRL